MTDDILVFDVGQNLIGIYSVNDDTYTPYEGKAKREGIALLQSAKEIVSYNGEHYDIGMLKKYSGLSKDEELPIEGVHTDMRTVCWSERIWGKNLVRTYLIHFPKETIAHYTEKTDNERDCYMAFKLWECMQDGTLKVIDGQEE